MPSKVFSWLFKSKEASTAGSVPLAAAPVQTAESTVLPAPTTPEIKDALKQNYMPGYNTDKLVELGIRSNRSATDLNSFLNIVSSELGKGFENQVFKKAMTEIFTKTDDKTLGEVFATLKEPLKQTLAYCLPDGPIRYRILDTQYGEGRGNGMHGPGRHG